MYRSTSILHLLFLCMFFHLLACKPNHGTSGFDREEIKSKYLNIAKEEIPILKNAYSKIILGHLNNDDQLDGVIAYSEIEGLRPINKKLILFIKAKANHIDFIPVQSIYCPEVDTIIDKTVLINNLENCLTTQPNLMSKHSLSYDGAKIKDQLIWSKNQSIVVALEQLSKDLQDDATDLSAYQFKNELGIEEKKFLNPLRNTLSKINFDQLMIGNESYIPKDQNLNFSGSIKLNENKIQIQSNSFEIIEEDEKIESSYFYNFEMKKEKLIFSFLEIAG